MPKFKVRLVETWTSVRGVEVEVEAADSEAASQLAIDNEQQGDYIDDWDKTYDGHGETMVESVMEV